MPHQPDELSSKKGGGEAETQRGCSPGHRGLCEYIGEDSDGPGDVPLSEFLDLLTNELSVLGNHMVMGCEYTSMISLRALSQALVEQECEYLGLVEVTDPEFYYKVTDKAQSAAMKFFNDYWRPGGRDVALLRAALTRVKVIPLFTLGTPSLLCSHFFSCGSSP